LAEHGPVSLTIPIKLEKKRPVVAAMSYMEDPAGPGQLIGASHAQSLPGNRLRLQPKSGRENCF
jgi:hypothetical protein